jgi:hypothetical protein
MLALKLSVLEFFRSCSRRAPGGRDFFWMTLLMFFVQLLALIILSAREGVLERSVDAFLGNRPGYGIPVWTLPNFLGNSQPVMITNELVDEVRDAGYYGAPFRRIYSNELIRLPGDNIWTAPGGPSGQDFSGMAADFSGPLYPALVTSAPPAPEALEPAWRIILDENLMRRYFDLGAYREAVRGRIPQSQYDAIPETAEALTEMPVIWLAARVHRREVLTPFRIGWSKYFGIGATDTAFIIPIEMYNTFLVAKENPDLCAFVDSGPDFRPRVMSIRSDRVFGMSADEREAFTARLDTLAEPLGGVVQQRGSRIVLDFDTPENGSETRDRACDSGVSALRFDLFLREAGIELAPDQVTTLEITDELAASPTQITGRCSAFTDQSLSKAQRTGEGANCVAQVPIADTATGYSEMLLYAENRLQIKNLVDYLSCRASANTPDLESSPNLCVLNVQDTGETESRLMINQIYEDSLTRFGFLTELLRAISGPIGVAMLLMLVAILWVQLGTVLGHRRIRYAMLLSNGLSWAQVKTMVVAQAAIGVCISLGFALAVFLLAKSFVLVQMAGITLTYEMITLGNPIDVLPMSGAIILVVFVATLITAIVLSLMQMRLNGLSPRSPLDRLLH